MSYDAHQIDQEIINLFKGQFDRIFQPFDAEAFHRYQPEVSAFFHLFLWWTCVWKNLPTPGMKLMNMNYVNGHNVGDNAPLPPNSRQKFVVVFCWVIAPWLLTRVKRTIQSLAWQFFPIDSAERKAWSLVNHTETALKYANLLNLIAYFGGSRGVPSLTERVSGLHLQQNNNESRNGNSINFQYMNRHLLVDSLKR
jgi:hypothetical protein